VSLRAPESVQKLQTALHAKAKEMPTFRFYALYDKLYREDVLSPCMAAGQGQWRGSWRGWTDLPGHRGVWRRAVAG
jgi:hypothetical protein